MNARKQMAKMVKQMGKGKMPNLQSIAAQRRRRERERERERERIEWQLASD